MWVMVNEEPDGQKTYAVFASLADALAAERGFAADSQTRIYRTRRAEGVADAIEEVDSGVASRLDERGRP
jgi:hypothetical protein